MLFNLISRFVLGCFIIIGLLGISYACSSSGANTGNQTSYSFSKINCYVRYMAATRELQAEITFRTDSTTGITGKVLFNDEAMIPKQLPRVGYQYRLIKNTPTFEKTNRFSYTEKDGHLVNMDIEFSPFDSLRFASSGLSREKGGLIIWNGAALEEEDGLIFIFKDAQENTFSINHSGRTKGGQFDILPEYSARLELGKASVQVVKKRTVLTQEKETTKMLTIEYYLGNIEFEVKQ